MKTKEKILNYLLENTHVEGRYTGGGDEPQIIVFKWSDDVDKEVFLSQFADDLARAVEETGVREIAIALEAFIGIYHANNRVKNQVGEGWIRHAEAALKKLKQ